MTYNCNLKIGCIYEYRIFYKLKIKGETVIAFIDSFEASCELTAKIKIMHRIRDEVKNGMAFDYRVECVD